MILSQVERSTDLCVDPITARARMRIDDFMDVDELNALIKSAELVIENRISSTLLPSKWVFHCKSVGVGVLLPVARVLSIIDIKLMDSDGVYQDLSVQDFEFEGYRVGTPASVLVPKFGKKMPYNDHYKALRVEFTAGFSSVSTIPADLITAVLMLAKHFDLNREATSEKVQNLTPIGVDHLILPYSWVSCV